MYRGVCFGTMHSDWVQYQTQELLTFEKQHKIPLILPKHTPRLPKVRAGSDDAEEGDVVDAGAVLDPAVGGRHAGDPASRFEGELQ